jgi:hypothetical protein
VAFGSSRKRPFDDGELALTGEIFLRRWAENDKGAVKGCMDPASRRVMMIGFWQARSGQVSAWTCLRHSGEICRLKNGHDFFLSIFVCVVCPCRREAPDFYSGQISLRLNVARARDNGSRSEAGTRNSPVSFLVWVLFGGGVEPHRESRQQIGKVAIIAKADVY